MFYETRITGEKSGLAMLDEREMFDCVSVFRGFIGG